MSNIRVEVVLWEVGVGRRQMLGALDLAAIMAGWMRVCPRCVSLTLFDTAKRVSFMVFDLRKRFAQRS